MPRSGLVPADRNVPAVCISHAKRRCSLSFPAGLLPLQCRVRMLQRIFASHPCTKTPGRSKISPLPTAQLGAMLVFSPGVCRQLEMLMQKKSPALANQDRGWRRWVPMGRGRHPCPHSFNERPDFRLNEQAAGVMTKPSYFKNRPKFKMLWTNVASSGISANIPCIGFL